MPIDSVSTLPTNTSRRRAEGRFYIGMAIMATATALAGFGPAIVEPGSRRAPMTWAVGLHGIVFGAWLVLFLGTFGLSTSLVATLTQTRAVE